MQIRSRRTNRHYVNSLAKLKNSIEMGTIGEVVKQRRCRPGYDICNARTKSGRLFRVPQNAERFLSYPGAKELTENPKIIALRDDPEIMRMIQEGRIVDLLQDPESSTR